jgi:FkbM family methyltransferase
MYPFTYIGNNRAMLQARNGFHYIFDPNDLSVSLHLLLRGCHEPENQAIMCNLVERGDRVVIVGSHIGYHDVALAHAVGAAGYLYCFEPNPESFSMLVHNMTMNGFAGRANCIEKAVGERTGNAKYYKLRNDSGGSSVGQVLACNSHKVCGTYDVECTTLDIHLAGKFGLLKIDAEGSEAAVIRGAKALIASDAFWNIIIEHNPDYYNLDLEEEVVWLREIGYKTKVVGGDPFDHKFEDLAACDVLFHKEM